MGLNYTKKEYSGSFYLNSATICSTKVGLVGILRAFTWSCRIFSCAFGSTTGKGVVIRCERARGRIYFLGRITSRPPRKYRPNASESSSAKAS